VKEKFKSLYVFAFIVFVIINIGAVFFVFKKYRKDNRGNLLVTTTKFKYSKVKETIASIESKLAVAPTDTVSIQNFESLILDKKYLDSILAFDHINDDALAKINDKIFDLNSKSLQLEQHIDSQAEPLN
jgi:hypothetical protein